LHKVNESARLQRFPDLISITVSCLDGDPINLIYTQTLTLS